MIQIALFALYTFVLTRVKPDWLPPVPVEERTLRGWALWRKCLRGIIPCAVLIFLVLGTIMLGIATPTESGAMGAVAAVVELGQGSTELGFQRAALADHRRQHLGRQRTGLHAGLCRRGLAPRRGSSRRHPLSPRSADRGARSDSRRQ